MTLEEFIEKHRYAYEQWGAMDDAIRHIRVNYEKLPPEHLKRLLENYASVDSETACLYKQALECIAVHNVLVMVTSRDPHDTRKFLLIVKPENASIAHILHGQDPITGKVYSFTDDCWQWCQLGGNNE